ncbi:hypothetical protein ADK78_02905 [Kitasatospora aureofaciens]|nr:hypothetical protein ADK78_02905 [Kitasatospora aureofaciens]KOT45827.1 hypothetical protein ADK84_03995 [Streptomyces sp. NRRL WC-3701]KOT67630.1 hypothetical protein ADK44_03065 [Streptomyces rimosus subsp. rimosus]KUJ25278.1 hypothetical protein ADK46_41320 [Streptomyces rimosus subsp. rimosus]
MIEDLRWLREVKGPPYAVFMKAAFKVHDLGFDLWGYRVTGQDGTYADAGSEVQQMKKALERALAEMDAAMGGIFLIASKGVEDAAVKLSTELEAWVLHTAEPYMPAGEARLYRNQLAVSDSPGLPDDYDELRRYFAELLGTYSYLVQQEFGLR